MADRRPIVRLPEETTARIAAGEVIERPMSVVRELLDNALDADATRIDISLDDGGREMIRVSDDGFGLSADEVELAFCRHATSKIATVADLSRLETLGFRGEALPSIAAVAEVTMATSCSEDGIGTLVVRRGDTTTNRQLTARQRGTAVTVRHLFRDLPARRRFLSPARVEAGLVTQLVLRYALAHPGVRFDLVLDERPVFKSSGSGLLERAIEDVYGSTTVHALHPLAEVAVGDATICGYLGGPAATRPTRESISLIVNGRCVYNHTILSALEAGYRPLLPRGRHPIAVIVIRVPPLALDPNVHPSKAEVRLLHESDIAEALKQKARETLGHAGLHAGAEADVDAPRLSLQYSLPTQAGSVRETRGLAWTASEFPAGAENEMFADARVIDQVHDTLILVQSLRGLLLVDQHRAHERVLFERLRQTPGSRAIEAQSLLDPIVLELSASRAALLDERRFELEALGLYCERFGHQDYLVRTIPTDVTTAPTPTSIGEMVAEMVDEATAETEGWRDRLMIALACRTAQRRGRRLQMEQMEELIRLVSQVPTPAVCPHGSPLVLELPGSYLHRQFRW